MLLWIGNPNQTIADEANKGSSGHPDLVYAGFGRDIQRDDMVEIGLIIFVALIVNALIFFIVHVLCWVLAMWRWRTAVVRQRAEWGEKVCEPHVRKMGSSLPAAEAHKERQPGQQAGSGMHLSRTG